MKKGKYKKKHKKASRKEIANKYADDLRCKETKPERRFREKLLKTGVRFKGQKIVYRDKSFYIIDFFILDRMLCIELDGGYHTTPEQIKKDNERDEYLVARGYHVWRMTNEYADTLSVENILTKIETYPSKAGKIRILAPAEEKIKQPKQKSFKRHFKKAKTPKHKKPVMSRKGIPHWTQMQNVQLSTP